MSPVLLRIFGVLRHHLGMKRPNRWEPLPNRYLSNSYPLSKAFVLLLLSQGLAHLILFLVICIFLGSLQYLGENLLHILLKINPTNPSHFVETIPFNTCVSELDF